MNIMKTSFLNRLTRLIASLSFLLLATWLTDLCLSAEKSVPAEEYSALKLRDIDSDTIGLYEGSTPLWHYVYRKKIHAHVAASDLRGIAGCYFHPLYGFDGNELTVNATTHDNHQHHHGLWPSFMTIIVHRPDGSNPQFDTWTDNGPLKRQFIDFADTMSSRTGLSLPGLEFLSKKDCAATLTMSVRNGWFLNEKEKIMDEHISMTTSTTYNLVRFGRIRIMELKLTLQPVSCPVTLAGDRKLRKNFSCFAWRFVKPIKKPFIQSANGEIKDDALQIELPWIDYYSDDAKGHNWGLAVFPDSNNPPFEGGWAVRHYGMIVAGWPGCKGTTLQPGKQVTLRYGMILHEKSLTAPELLELKSFFLKEANH